MRRRSSSLLLCRRLLLLWRTSHVVVLVIGRLDAAQVAIVVVVRGGAAAAAAAAAVVVVFFVVVVLVAVPMQLIVRRRRSCATRTRASQHLQVSYARAMSGCVRPMRARARRCSARARARRRRGGTSTRYARLACSSAPRAPSAASWRPASTPVSSSYRPRRHAAGARVAVPSRPTYLRASPRGRWRYVARRSSSSRSVHVSPTRCSRGSRRRTGSQVASHRPPCVTCRLLAGRDLPLRAVVALFERTHSLDPALSRSRPRIAPLDAVWRQRRRRRRRALVPDARGHIRLADRTPGRAG